MKTDIEADLSRFGSSFLKTVDVLVRLPIEQLRLDRSEGLKTEAFISGYEGSPLAGYDLRLAHAKRALDKYGVHFVPGFNEELAATSVMGTQMAGRVAPESYGLDGVVGFWYGKAPGLDRAADALRHGNFAGTAGAGAVVLLVGDDPTAKSSTLPSDSRATLQSLGIPVLEPGDTQEVLEYGLAAVALSRYAGAWTALKLVTGVCDAGGTITIAEDRRPPRQPTGEYRKKYGHLLMSPQSVALETEVNVHRLNAACRFSQLNGLNRMYGADRQASLGIMAAGKTYYDVLQAIRDMGISMEDLALVGVRLAQLSMTYPLDPMFVQEFAAGLNQIVVVEEKRSFVEAQLRDILYASAMRPEIIGKFDLTGAEFFPAHGELSPDPIARKLAPLLARRAPEWLATRIVKRVREISAPPSLPPVLYNRKPTYCSGCPHNLSTVEIAGSPIGGGIGCHTLGMNLADAGRGFQILSQMGGEGAPFIGVRPFVDQQQHFFQNIGDGTFFHSGSLSVQACIAQGMNVTFRLLNNHAVAMTGGQAVQGALEPSTLSRKLEAEGVTRTVIITRQPKRISGIARNAELRPPSQLKEVMRELQSTPGVTVLIYDQECAAELRRMRNVGERPRPMERVVIHEQVCEGCGHCVSVSNCISLRPVGTPNGPKMSVHQSSCNQDFSCAVGDCPSFVSVTLAEGGGAAKPKLPELDLDGIPAPPMIPLQDEGYRIVLMGIGGDGIVSIAKSLANAASIDGLWVTTSDETGLAQKSGSVVSHLYLGSQRLQGAVRANRGAADLLIAYDLVTARRADVVDTLDPTKTVAVLNTNVVVPAEQVRKGAWEVPDLARPLVDRLGTLESGKVIALDGSRLAEALFEDHFAVNSFLLGIAFQKGWIPISLDSMRAGMIPTNWEAFSWGRKYAHEPEAIKRVLDSHPVVDPVPVPATVLRKYQNERWAQEYAAYLENVDARLKSVVGRNLLRLMTYKDEYEVARLLTSTEFHEKLRRDWRGIVAVHFHLHPPVLRWLGLGQKIRVGQMARPFLCGLAGLSFLRGTPLDVFGRTKVRRAERSLIDWYRQLVCRVSAVLTAENLPIALEILDLPAQIRGYEEIKMASIERVLALAEDRLRSLPATMAAPVGLEDQSSESRSVYA
jgi:indolepyruvate ferredoxin oxidoreductase